MNREEIIHMAREAGLDDPHAVVHAYCELKLTDHLERFAALVAAAEREKLAACMMRQGYATGHGDTVEDLLKELEWQIEERIRNEREACARLCDQMFHDWCNQEFEDEDEAYRNRPDAEDCKKAIRARGQA